MPQEVTGLLRQRKIVYALIKSQAPHALKPSYLLYIKNPTEVPTTLQTVKLLFIRTNEGYTRKQLPQTVKCFRERVIEDSNSDDDLQPQQRQQ